MKPGEITLHGKSPVEFNLETRGWLSILVQAMVYNSGTKTLKLQWYDTTTDPENPVWVDVEVEFGDVVPGGHRGLMLQNIEHTGNYRIVMEGAMNEDRMFVSIYSTGVLNRSAI